VRIVVLVSTLVVAAAAVVVLLSELQKNQRVDHRRALENSEQGLMLALERLHQQPSWREGLPKTSHRGGWYRVELRPEKRSDTLCLDVEAQGGSGAVVRRKAMLLRLEERDGDSMWVSFVPD
jgi:hypothetical protein